MLVFKKVCRTKFYFQNIFVDTFLLPKMLALTLYRLISCLQFYDKSTIEQGYQLP